MLHARQPRPCVVFIDVEMRDQDDYDYILANLACSLTASCPR